MKFKQNTKEYYEFQYGKNEFFSPKDICFVVYDKEIWDSAKELLKSSKKVVDLGAGGGTLLHNISRVTNAELIGIDFSSTAINYLKRAFPNVDFLNEDVTKTSLEDKSCDFVVSTMTIEHLEDDTVFLEEVYRILVNGGHFLLTTVFKKPYAWYFYKNRRGETVLEPSHTKEYTSLNNFLGLLENNGFIILKVKTPKLKFPLIDIILKKLCGIIRNEFWNSLPTIKPVEYLRKVTRVPIPGYYSLEVIAKKRN